MPGRLEGKRVAVLFVGPVDRRHGVRGPEGRASTPEAPSFARARSACRSTRSASRRSCKQQPAFRRFAGRRPARRSRRGARRELVGRREDAALGRTRRVARARARGPLGASRRRGRGRARRPSRSGARRRRSSPVSTRASPATGVPAVGVEPSDAGASAIPAFALAGLSTVDSVDTSAGRLGPRAAARRRRPGQLRRRGDRHGRRPAPGHSLAGAGVSDRLTILVAARDEETRIGETVESLRSRFPGAEIVVADDGSRDRTAAVAAAAGARVITLGRRGKGQALTLAERAARARAAPAVRCGSRRRRASARRSTDADLAIAVFAAREGGGFGIAKRAARAR